jgi:hypothetical protein
LHSDPNHTETIWELLEQRVSQRNVIIKYTKGDLENCT